MYLQNASINVTHFIIGGFDTVIRPEAIGVVMLIIYLLVVLANTVNILFIIFDKRLHKPMYLLVCNLAVVDIIYTSSTSPTMIGVLLAGVNTISYVECIIQMFVFHLGAVMERLALAIMAFDRLIAIICPFQYHSYLTNTRVVFLTYILWFVGSGFAALAPAVVVRLPHCYSRLKYTFCDYAAVLRTTCKMGGTLLSHLICVTCHYCPAFIIIVLTRLGVALSLEERQGLLIGTILGPSLVNPFVYSLRTTEIKTKIFRILKNGWHV
ncbi:olfactory receptor 6N1-like [Oreochromis aureus]|uniref:olfactory receptor 6N1-like n=1 Tax=Oreochromis aureus TaxID=47969 RepID=UPI001953DD7F|nr:olfactory receptor 6N1-like [Oreochromis aureus]